MLKWLVVVIVEIKVFRKGRAVPRRLSLRLFSGEIALFVKQEIKGVESSLINVVLLSAE